MGVELTIASGTESELTVFDIRGKYRWSQSSGDGLPPGTPRHIIVHHTVSPPPDWHVIEEVLALVRLREQGAYGVPYNFVIFPSGSIYYVNDIDGSWPHTAYYNQHTAAAIVGDYTHDIPPDNALQALFALVRALRAMNPDQYSLPVRGHRQMPKNNTICPGDGIMQALKEAYGD